MSQAFYPSNIGRTQLQKVSRFVAPCLSLVCSLASFGRIAWTISGVWNLRENGGPSGDASHSHEISNYSYVTEGMGARACEQFHVSAGSHLLGCNTMHQLSSDGLLL